MEPLENEKQWKINEIARVATVPIIIACLLYTSDAADE